MENMIYDLLLPSQKYIKYTPNTSYTTNSIVFKSVILYGRLGVGKTEVARNITEKAVEKYGVDNVNPKYIPKGRYLPELMEYGLDNKLVQVLFVDNCTLSEIPNEVLEDYFTIRHSWYKQTGRPYGLILFILACHRLHGIRIKELRTYNDAIIFFDDPSSPYDESIVKRYIGEGGIQKLRHFEKERRKRPDSEYRSKSIYWTREGTGILESDMAKNDYLEEVTVPIYNILERY